MPERRRVAVMLDLEWSYKWHARTFAGTQAYSQEHGWESTMDEYVDDTLSHCPMTTIPYDGVIARATRKLARQTARLKIPLVNVWYGSPVWNEVPSVFPDYPASGRLQAEHLLTRGFQRFAGLIFEKDRPQAVALEAFVDTVDEAGCPCVTEKLPPYGTSTVKTWRETERVINRCMKDWKLPIGVYVGPASKGRMVAQLCRNRGWRVPEDVAIISGWNDETFCEQLQPTLTSVELGFERIGYEAARLLDRLMNGEAPPTKPILLPAQGLVVRESSDFYAVDDPLLAAALRFIATKSQIGIGPDDVARAVATATRTLQRHFQKHLQRTIADEIRRVRIERAKRELSRSKHSMAQIARDVGFGRAMRMYDVFRRELGVTPRQYRKQRRNE